MSLVSTSTRLLYFNIFVAIFVLTITGISNSRECFLNANSWVFNVFPNAKEELSIKNQVSRKKILNSKYLILNTLADKVEKLLKSLQLYFINRHRIKEIITDTQLWFHPEDFGEKIKVLE